MVFPQAAYANEVIEDPQQKGAFRQSKSRKAVIEKLLISVVERIIALVQYRKWGEDEYGPDYESKPLPIGKIVGLKGRTDRLTRIQHRYRNNHNKYCLYEEVILNWVFGHSYTKDVSNHRDSVH